MAQAAAQVSGWENRPFTDKTPSILEKEAHVVLIGKLALAVGASTTLYAFTATVISMTPLILAIASFVTAYFCLTQTEFKNDPDWLNKIGKAIFDDHLKLSVADLPPYQVMKARFNRFGITPTTKEWSLLFQATCNAKLLDEFLKMHTEEGLSVLSDDLQTRLVKAYALSQLFEQQQRLLPHLGNFIRKRIDEELDYIESSLDNKPDIFSYLFSYVFFHPIKHYFPHLTAVQKDRFKKILELAILKVNYKELLKDGQYREELSPHYFDMSEAKIVALRKNLPLPQTYYAYLDAGHSVSYTEALLQQRPDLKEKMQDLILDSCYPNKDVYNAHLKVLDIDEKAKDRKVLRDAQNQNYAFFKATYLQDKTIEAFLEGYEKSSSQSQQQQAAAPVEHPLRAALRISFKQHLIDYMLVIPPERWEEEYGELAFFKIDDKECLELLTPVFRFEVQRPQVLFKPELINWPLLANYGSKILKSLLQDQQLKADCAKAFLECPSILTYKLFCELLGFDEENQVGKKWNDDQLQLPYSAFKAKYLHGVAIDKYPNWLHQALSGRLIQEVKERVAKGENLDALCQEFSSDIKNLCHNEASFRHFVT